MDKATVRALCALNNEFYREQAESFSASREEPWPGWRRVLGHMGSLAHARGTDGTSWAEGVCDMADEVRHARLSVLDAACGNLRFERFLDAEYAGEFDAFAVDSCDALALPALREHDFLRGNVVYHCADFIEALIDGGAAGLAWALETSSCDAAVSFGFMHHVPGEENRVAMLRALVGAVRFGGVVAVSLWRFAESEKGRAKAVDFDRRALGDFAQGSLDALIGLSEEARQVLGAGGKLHGALEPGDHFLGWKNQPHVWRYCHSFSDDEIDRLVASVDSEATFLDRFCADGKTNDMNAYLVLKKR